MTSNHYLDFIVSDLLLTQECLDAQRLMVGSCGDLWDQPDLRRRTNHIIVLS